MLQLLKELITSKKLYISATVLAVTVAGTLILLDSVIMPAYTNYDEGVTVPDVTQLSLEEAKDQLTSYGLRFEIAERRSNQAFPANYVIDQNPVSPEIVKPERKIYLTINTITIPKVEVPRVENLSFRNAQIQLQNHGLQLGTVSYASSRFKNTVMRQSIEPGKIVEKGAVINLTVSDGLGEKIVKVPNIIGIKLTKAQQKLRETGLRVGEIKFQPTKEVTPNTILDYTPKKKEVVEGETLKLIVSERFEVKEENESAPVQVDTSYIANPDSTRQ